MSSVSPTQWRTLPQNHVVSLRSEGDSLYPILYDYAPVILRYLLSCCAWDVEEGLMQSGFIGRRSSSPHSSLQEY
jgi:hypothetical protein